MKAAKAKFSWFRFHAAEWRGSRRLANVSLAGRGLFVELLCEEWEHGPLPDNPALLAKLVGIDRRTFAALWPSVRPLFELDSTSNLVSFKLESEKKRARIESEKNAKAAKTRWSADANAMLSEKLEVRSKKEKTEETLAQPKTAERANDSKKAQGCEGLKCDPAPEPKGEKCEPSVGYRSFDFDAVYALYPRKVGKKAGLRRCVSQVTSVRKFESLVMAVKNYARYVAGEPERFVKHFSSFMGEWEDWIEPKDPPKQAALPTRANGHSEIRPQPPPVAQVLAKYRNTVEEKPV